MVANYESLLKIQNELKCKNSRDLDENQYQGVMGRTGFEVTDYEYFLTI